MKIKDLSTSRLRRILRATERDVGPESVEARIMRRELTRRSNLSRAGRHRQTLGRLGGSEEAADAAPAA